MANGAELEPEFDTVGSLAAALVLPLLATAVALALGGWTLSADLGCEQIEHGIVALELSSTSEQAAVVVADCSDDGLTSSITRDFFFIPAYTLALVLWARIGVGRAVRIGGSRSAARRLVWAAIVAGLLDVIENVLMLVTIDADEPDGAVTTITAAAAIAKFALLLAVVAFASWVAVTLIWRTIASAVALVTPPRRLVPLFDRPGLAVDVDNAGTGPSEINRFYKAPGGGAWPDAGSDVTGIAFSGGGIRAASFSAGALEAFQAQAQAAGGDRSPVLRRARYMSSVSGGGWLAGGFQHALVRLDGSPPTGPEPFADGSPESEFLEGNVRFLWRRPVPGRFFGLSGEPGTTPWNLISTLWTFVVHAAFNVVLLGAIVFAISRPLGWAAAVIIDPTGTGTAEPLPTWASFVALVVVGAVFGWVFRQLISVDRTVVYWLVVAVVAGTVLVWQRFGWLTLRWWFLAVVAGGALVLFWFTARLRKAVEEEAAIEGVQPPWWVDVIPVPSAAVAVWVVLAAGRWARTAQDGYLEGGLAHPTSLGALAVSGWILAGLMVAVVVFAAVRHMRGGSGRAIRAAVVTALAGLGLGVLAAAAIGTGGVIHGGWLWCAVVAALVVLYVAVDQHRWALHRQYKERLASTFAIDRTPTGPKRLDYELPTVLDEWAQPAPDHPQLIVSCAANIRGARTTGFGPQRRAQEFAFTHEWVGGPEIGWTRTQNYADVLARNREDCNLQAAVAISGAAFSSAMGESKVLAGWESILALLNLRLGAWLPNPQYVRELRDAGRQGNRIGPWIQLRRFSYLLKEIFRVHDSRDRFVNVSDGGHLDNTGLLELVKRRCTEIWYVDGTQLGDNGGVRMGAIEAAMTFGRDHYGLTGPEGVDVLESVRTQMASLISANGNPPTANIGPVTFTYPAVQELGLAEQTATIYLIRCALDAEQEADPQDWVIAARAADGQFPHTPTFNQFLHEEAFEGYVSLGRELTKRALTTWG